MKAVGPNGEEVQGRAHLLPSLRQPLLPLAPSSIPRRSLHENKPQMSSSLTDEELATCKAFRAHDFDADEEFQSTYQKLDDQGIAPELLKAQLHFYSSKHTPISLSSYRRYLKPHTTSSSSNNEPSQHDRSSVLTGDEQPPAPIPFQELAALIAEGRIGEVPVMETRDGVVQEVSFAWLERGRGGAGDAGGDAFAMLELTGVWNCGCSSVLIRSRRRVW
ncbi:hypothetical protein BDY24DRAFT_380646 [Mrakia frigida]|uniref:uncharacterized protein n=1 Tax=Mrakia frigida TaxID=29902 RepID=UPI003FCC133A